MVLLTEKRSAPAGVGLEGKAKVRFNEIQQELSKLSTKFGNNLLDATKAFSKLVTDKKDVEGLPGSALALAAQQVSIEPRGCSGCMIWSSEHNTSIRSRHPSPHAFIQGRGLNGYF